MPLLYCFIDFAIFLHRVVDLCEDGIFFFGLFGIELVGFCKKSLFYFLRNFQNFTSGLFEFFYGLDGFINQVFMLSLGKPVDGSLDKKLEIVRKFFPCFLVNEEDLGIAGCAAW